MTTIEQVIRDTARDLSEIVSTELIIAAKDPRLSAEDAAWLRETSEWLARTPLAFLMTKYKQHLAERRNNHGN